jgi:hypothetical protein
MNLVCGFNEQLNYFWFIQPTVEFFDLFNQQWNYFLFIQPTVESFFIYSTNGWIRRELYRRVKSNRKPIFRVDVEFSFASMCTFPLEVIFNYGIFYISVDIVMITHEDTDLLGSEQIWEVFQRIFGHGLSHSNGPPK